MTMRPTAISAYGSKINTTPNIDRIADGGGRLDSCFCTNSICTPSRAAILTGTYNHVNQVTTLDTHMDNSLETFPKLLQGAGYQTAMVGKWHLGHGPNHDPTGFDFWRVLPGQGHYHNPVMLGPDSEVIERSGYVTDLITDDWLDWLDGRDADRPFALLCHHKAPHRIWEPSREHFTMYDDVDIPEPETLFDDNASRAAVVQAMKIRLLDLDPIIDLNEESLRMPFLVRYPARVAAGVPSEAMALNVDVDPTFCELAGIGAVRPRSRPVRGHQRDRRSWLRRGQSRTRDRTGSSPTQGRGRALSAPFVASAIARVRGRRPGGRVPKPFQRLDAGHSRFRRRAGGACRLRASVPLPA